MGRGMEGAERSAYHIVSVPAQDRGKEAQEDEPAGTARDETR